MTSISQATLDTYSAIQVDVTNRSGFMAYVTHGGEYAVSTPFCDCPDVEIALFRTGREADGDLQAVYVCLNHGTHTSSALRCGNPAVRDVTISRASAGRIFGYSEQLARAAAKKSKVPQWGFHK
jgi:predicted nucleic acid-binding Zn finger protein